MGRGQVTKTLLAALAGSGLALAGLYTVDRALASGGESPAGSPGSAPGPPTIWRDRFPDVELQTHDGRTVRFYEDLIAGKIVALNFMYVGCTKF